MKFLQHFIIGVLMLSGQIFAQGKKAARPPSMEVVKQVKEFFGKYDYQQKVKFINPDGLTGYELQTSKKTSFESDAFWKADDDTMSYLYEFPRPVKDSVDARNKGTISIYPPGGENILSAFNWSKVVQRSGDTLIIPFDNRDVDNPYGKRFDWTHPGNFKNYSRAWIFPEGMLPVSYRCNKKGVWTLKRNVLQFVAEPNQNEFNFELKYLQKSVRPAELAGRPVNYVKEITVSSDTIFLEIRDDQEEDGDMVSLYYNREWIGRNIAVSKNPMRFFVVMEPGQMESSFILHSGSEGLIPPNTADLTIISGDKRYSVLLSSSRSGSAGILFRR
jgi:hypothetical protein